VEICNLDCIVSLFHHSFIIIIVVVVVVELLNYAIFSELPQETRVKGHKKYDSVTLIEESSSIPQKCDDTSVPHFGRENISSEKIIVDMKPCVVGNTLESIPGCPAKVETSFITSLDFAIKSYFKLFYICFDVLMLCFLSGRFLMVVLLMPLTRVLENAVILLRL